MISVIIPYRKTYSAELQWTIKSLQKHLKQPHKVFIIGDSPDFDLDATILRAKYEWERISPYHDTLGKYWTAVNHPAVSEDVLLMADDIFLMNDYQLKNYNRGTIIDHINARTVDSYTTALKDTLSHLESLSLPAVDYELHLPLYANKTDLHTAIEELIPYTKLGRKLLPRSYYANRFNIASEYLQDVKNPSDYQDRLFLSTNEETFTTGEIGEYIRGNL